MIVPEGLQIKSNQLDHPRDQRRTYDEEENGKLDRDDFRENVLAQHSLINRETDELQPHRQFVENVKLKRQRELTKLHPNPRKRILAHVGVTTLAIANVMTHSA